MDRRFFEKFHFVGQLQLRRKRRCIARNCETKNGRLLRYSDLHLRRREAGFGRRHAALGKGGSSLPNSRDVKALTLKSIKNQLRNMGGFTWAGYDEAANWCLDNNYNLDEALTWEDTSIQNEDRFENWETKSRILAAMGKKDESDKALATAMSKATAIQLYSYARGIQRSGDAKRAFE